MTPSSLHERWGPVETVTRQVVRKAQCVQNTGKMGGGGKTHPKDGPGKVLMDRDRTRAGHEGAGKGRSQKDALEPRPGRWGKHLQSTEWEAQQEGRGGQMPGEMCIFFLRHWGWNFLSKVTTILVFLRKVTPAAGCPLMNHWILCLKFLHLQVFHLHKNLYELLEKLLCKPITRLYCYLCSIKNVWIFISENQSLKIQN